MGSGSFPEPDKIGSVIGRGGPPMEYFAGLDVSMAETHVCVVTRNGAVIHQAKVPSTPADSHHHACHAATRHRVQTGVVEQHSPHRRSNRAPERSDARGRVPMRAPLL